MSIKKNVVCLPFFGELSCNVHLSDVETLFVFHFRIFLKPCQVMYRFHKTRYLHKTQNNVVEHCYNNEWD